MLYVLRDEALLWYGGSSICALALRIVSDRVGRLLCLPTHERRGEGPHAQVQRCAVSRHMHSDVHVSFSLRHLEIHM